MKRKFAYFVIITLLLVFAYTEIQEPFPSVSYKVEYKRLPYKTVIRYSNTAEKGVEFLVHNGSYGKVKLVYRERVYKGKVIDKQLVSKDIVIKPVPKVLIVGKAVFNYRYIKKLSVIATAYSPRVCETDSTPWITATGMRSRVGIVAVDPRVIPLRTILYIPHYGYAIAGDTGSAIKGNRIDLFFYSTKQAYQWGRKSITIYVVKYPNIEK